MKYSIPYGKQDITDSDISAVVEALRHPFLTQGPKIAEFEEAFADYIGVDYAVAVNNGTAALHLAAIVAGVHSSSRVITSSLTFAATANAVRYCGGSVQFVDIDPRTLLLDIQKVRELLESSPRGTYDGLMPIDFAGYPVEMESFRALADEFGLWIIEDACHALGGYFTDSRGQKQYCGNGKYADMAVFSFHPVKHIACGEGGMITTNSKAHYQRLLKLRTHGITKDADELQENHGGWYYEIQELGYNYRLTDIQCALGLSQLEMAGERIEMRRRIAAKYDRAFKDTGIKIHRPAAGIGHAYHLYVIETNERKQLYDALRSNGIYSQVHYVPVHLLPYYQNLGWKRGDLPQVENYYSRCLSLPMYPTLTAEEQDYVVAQTLKVAG